MKSTKQSSKNYKRRPRRPAFRPPSVPTYSLSSFPTFYADQPFHKLAKLQYTHIAALPQIGVGTITEIQFRANGMFDPQYATGGHQPFGYDQLMAQYCHYTVLYASCDLEITSNKENQNSQYSLWITAAPGQLQIAYNASGVQGMVEFQPHSPSLTVSSGVYIERNKSTHISWSAPNFFGKTAANLIGDSRFQGDETADPAEDAYFVIGGYHPTGLSVLYTDASYKLNLTYYAVFTEPRKIVAS
jgi:hypothetical protein